VPQLGLGVAGGLGRLAAATSAAAAAAAAQGLVHYEQTVRERMAMARVAREEDAAAIVYRCIALLVGGATRQGTSGLAPPLPPSPLPSASRLISVCCLDVLRTTSSVLLVLWLWGVGILVTLTLVCCRVVTQLALKIERRVVKVRWRSE